MTSPVVVIGPGAVTGTVRGSEELVSVALSSVDDHLAVYGDRVVPVRQLWRELFSEVLGAEPLSSVTVVVPSWWSSSRTDVVVDALRERCASVAVLARARVVGGGVATVVEFGEDVVVVHEPSGGRIALPSSESRVEDILGPAAGVVVVDAPDGLPAARELVRRLRHRGIAVSSVDDDGVRAAACRLAGTAPLRRHLARPVLVTSVALLAAAAGLTVAAFGGRGEPAAVTWVVEGRVAVEVPARWRVERIVEGPGSARVQVSSSDGQQLSIHLTQAKVSDTETLPRTADALRDALEDQPDDLFVDFAPDGRYGGRAAVTYRELRASGTVDWAVFVEDGVRIAVGCRHGADDRGPFEVCEHAVRSARVVNP